MLGTLEVQSSPLEGPLSVGERAADLASANPHTVTTSVREWYAFVVLPLQNLYGMLIAPIHQMRFRSA